MLRSMTIILIFLRLHEHLLGKDHKIVMTRGFARCKQWQVKWAGYKLPAEWTIQTRFTVTVIGSSVEFLIGLDKQVWRLLLQDSCKSHCRAGPVTILLWLIPKAVTCPADMTNTTDAGYLRLPLEPGNGCSCWSHHHKRDSMGSLLCLLDSSHSKI